MAVNVNNIDANELHSAIATWSGFVYQGKIAIYHVIRLLIEDVNSHRYALQLDSLDDFAVIDNNGDILSLHQVKSERSDLYTNYVDAFNKLVERNIDYQANNAYFHLAVQNRMDADAIQAAHPTLFIYQYLNGNYYCALDEIDESIEALIRNYHTSLNLVELSTVQNIKAIRFRLEEMILKQVVGIHSENHKGNVTIREGAFYLTIPFEIFKTVLETDMAEWLTNEGYFIHLFKREINTCYQEYLLELAENNIVFDSEIEERLSKYLIHISSLDSDDILKFIRSIFPHRTFKLNSILDYGKVAPKEEELKDAFFLILKNITKDANMDKCKLSWQSPSKEVYVPSAIHSSDISRVSKQIIKNIIETDLAVAFESQKIITPSLNINSIYDIANNTNNIVRNDGDTNIDFDENESKRITRWQTVSLVSIENAKNELNND